MTTETMLPELEGFKGEAQELENNRPTSKPCFNTDDEGKVSSPPLSKEASKTDGAVRVDVGGVDFYVTKKEELESRVVGIVNKARCAISSNERILNVKDYKMLDINQSICDLDKAIIELKNLNAKAKFRFDFHEVDKKNDNSQINGGKKDGSGEETKDYLGDHQEGSPEYKLFKGEKGGKENKKVSGLWDLRKMFLAKVNDLKEYRDSVADLLKVSEIPDAPIWKQEREEAEQFKLKVVNYNKNIINLFAAASGVGKTTMLIDNAVEFVEQDQKVCFMGLEETVWQTTQSMFKNRIGRVDFKSDGVCPFKKFFNDEKYESRFKMTFGEFLNKFYTFITRSYVLKNYPDHSGGDSENSIFNRYKDYIDVEDGNYFGLNKSQIEECLKSYGELFDGGDDGDVRPLRVSYHPQGYISEISAYIEKNAEKGYTVFLIDYVGRLQLQLEPSKTEKPIHEQLREVSNELNRLAIRLKITIVIAAQLNRQEKEDSKKPPSQNHIADSSDLYRSSATCNALKKGPDDAGENALIYRYNMKNRGFQKRGTVTFHFSEGFRNVVKVEDVNDANSKSGGSNKNKKATDQDVL